MEINYMCVETKHRRAIFSVPSCICVLVWNLKVRNEINIDFSIKNKI